MTDLFQALAAPFPPDRVHWRVGSTTQDKSRGMALPYIDARDVMDRLDEVMGPANWQDAYTIVGNRTICTLSLRPDTEWISKSDAAGDTDVEGEKGSVSDALKRAAVKWGIGRYLYRLDSPWVELEQRGRSHVIKPSEHARLRALLGGGAQKPAAPKPSHDAPIPGSDQEAERAESFTQATIRAISERDNRAALNRVMSNPTNKPHLDWLEKTYPEKHARIMAAKVRRETDLENKAA